MAEQKYAFRCKHCGHLLHAGAAGELTHPKACPVCGRGVYWRHHEIADALAGAKDEAERKQYVSELRDLKVGAHRHLPDNWEVLADATPGRLEEIGLTATQVERHVPAPKASPAREPRHHEVAAEDGVSTTDSAGIQ